MQKTSRQYIHFLALWRESTRLLHSIGHFWGGFCLTVAAAALGFSPFAAKWSSPLFCIFTSNFSLLPAALQPRQKQQLREQTKIQRWLLSFTVLYRHINLVSLVGTFCRGSLCLHWLRHGPQQSAVEVWHEESWVGVFLHEAVDDPLSIVEAHRGGRLDVPSDHVSGFVVYVDLEAERKVVTCGQTPKVGRWLGVVVSAYLSHSLGLNVTFEDHLGPVGHPKGGLDLLVVLAHSPEFNVLVAELWLEEGLEDLCTVWKQTGPCETRGCGALAAESWPKKSEEPFHLHLEASSLSRESDHWDVSSTQSLWETMASFKSNYKVWPRSRYKDTRRFHLLLSYGRLTRPQPWPEVASPG